MLMEIEYFSMFRDVPLFGTMQCKKICGNSLLTRQLRIMICLLYTSTQNGCSLLLVNSSKGHRLFEKLQSLTVQETSLDEAVKYNAQLKAPSELPLSRKDRILEYEKMTGSQIQKEYLRKHKKRYLKGLLKSMIPYKVKLIIRGGVQK